jgi:hypothetical protein
MSGLSRTPGKRVWVNSPPRVRIPLAPPKQKPLLIQQGLFHLSLGMVLNSKIKNPQRLILIHQEGL